MNASTPTLDGGERVEDNDPPASSSRPTVTVLPDSVIVSDDTEHVYAVLEQTHAQPTNVAQLNKATEQAPNPQYVTNQTGPKSQSTTWAPGQHSKIRPKLPRHENLDLVLNVTVEMEERTATNTENEHSYPANFRKHSLPANFSEQQHSTANTLQDCPVFNGNENGSNEVTDEPIYIMFMLA